MAARCGIILATILTSFLATCYGEVFFSKLPNNLLVSTSPSGTVNLTAGVSQITVTWELNQNSKSIDTSSYKTVKINLCYLPISQKDRPWRKTSDELVKDKTCQHLITSKPYTPSNNTFTHTVKRDVPTAEYFVRAYVLDITGTKVAYGQTTVGDQLSITGITGQHASLEIASAVFSAFSVVSLAGFFYLEKKKAKRAT